MMTWEKKDHILFTADAFGSYGTLDGGISDEDLDLSFFEDEFIRYYSNIVGKFSNPVQAILKKLKGMPFQIIASTHGPVFKKQETIQKMFSLYDKLSRNETDSGVVIAFASMYGNTEAMADVIARELAVQGIRNIRIYDVSKTHPSYIIRDIFKYKGLILGSSTYNLDLHPNMHTLISELEAIGIKNHVYGCFGTFSWAGRAAKKLEEFGLRMNWEMIATSIEEKGSLKIDKYNDCIALALAMANRLKNGE
jgi:flavorubredoxin